jgi:hypothetical protein
VATVLDYGTFVETALIGGTFAATSMEHLQHKLRAVEHMWQQF